MALLILSAVIILSLILIVLGLPGLWIMVASAGDATRVAKGALIGRVVSTVLKIGIGFTIGIWIFIAAMK